MGIVIRASIWEVSHVSEPCAFIDGMREGLGAEIDGMREGLGAEIAGRRGMLAYVAQGGSVKVGDTVTLT